MAKIRPVYEAKEHTLGAPSAEIPISEAIALFELRPTDFISDLPRTPRGGNVDRDLNLVGSKHVVAETERSEGRQANSKSDIYSSRTVLDRSVRRRAQ